METNPPLAPVIAAQLNHLLVNSALPIKVENILSGCRDGRYSDRFTLLIPFCLEYVKWEVIFNAYYPSAPPDFIFPQEYLDFNPLLDSVEDKRESNLFADWNSFDPSKLLSLVNQLRDLFIIYQKKKVVLLEDEKFKFELHTVLYREGMEVGKTSFPDKDEVKFSIPITDLDFYKLVPTYPWKQEQKIFLQVVYPIMKSHSKAPPRIKMVSTPEMKTFFNVDDIKLIPWSDQMSMAAYLFDLEENLKEQVVIAAADIGKRRRFIEALATYLGRPIEADPVFYRRATVMCMSGFFSFLVHLSIPLQFPYIQPMLKLQSTQHFNMHGLPIVYPSIINYPWSPRWDNSQMAERIFDYLADACLTFKKYCSEMQTT